MGFKDFWDGKQSFTELMTGRSDRQHDLYAEITKVDEVVENISNVASNQVQTARTEVSSAINNINNVTGVVEYLGGVNAGGYESIFDGIAEGVLAIGQQMQAKADAIKIYEEAGTSEKILSTLSMIGAKTGEGFLSVFEEIGDAGLSVYGWAAGKAGNEDGQKKAEELIKKDWSHDAFNFYYNSDFSKKAGFTEDSGLASVCEIAGSTAGYLALGGAVSSAAGVLGAGSTRLGGLALKMASGSTWGATTTAAVGGFGYGTESSLKSGNSLSDGETLRAGLKGAAIQGGLAMVGGKAGEGLARRGAVNAATKEVDDLARAVETGTKEVDDLTKATNKAADAFNHNPGLASEELDDLTKMYTKAENRLTNAKTALEENRIKLEEAKTNLVDVKNSKWSSYQGYDDALTRVGQKVGEKAGAGIGTVANAGKSVVTGGVTVAKSGATALKETAAASKAIRKGTMEAAAKTEAAHAAQQTFKNDVKALAKPITNTRTAIVEEARAAGNQLNTAQRELNNAMKSGEPLTEAKWNTLVEARDTARTAYESFGGDSKKLIEAVNKAANTSDVKNLTPKNPSKSLSNTGFSNADMRSVSSPTTLINETAENAGSLKNVVSTSLGNATTSLKSGVSGLKGNVSTAATGIANNVKSGLSEIAQNGIKGNIKNAVSGVANIAKSGVTASLEPATAAMATGIGINSIANSANIPNNAGFMPTDLELGRGVPESWGVTSSESGSSGGGSSSTGGYSGGGSSSTGGNSSGGSSLGGYSGGGSSSSTGGYSGGESSSSGGSYNSYSDGSSSNTSGTTSSSNTTQTDENKTNQDEKDKENKLTEEENKLTEEENKTIEEENKTSEEENKEKENKTTEDENRDDKNNLTEDETKDEDNQNPIEDNIIPEINNSTNNDNYIPNDYNDYNNYNNGNYNNGNYYGGYNDYNDGTGETIPPEEPIEPIETPIEEPPEEPIEGGTVDISKDKKYTKIPTVTPTTPAQQKKSSNAVIPVAAGLTAATAAGLGAKTYMDMKENSNNGEAEEEWEPNNNTDEDYYEEDIKSDETFEKENNQENENEPYSVEAIEFGQKYGLERDFETANQTNPKENMYKEYQDYDTNDDNVERYGVRKNNELEDFQ